ncbi:dolichyl-phosphate-mannose-protein mannosyltransferase domain protein [Leptospira alexanderi serovar Manhao 3 str. L 60]|uniref:Dolichyl-phosphate-mannose-protein mannosyltransferase domain protein n=1 Tax=Leptospira alexanderi serovar Manhao 3 str. L 60 TaxID=1049759 RepID=V6HT56_9LEPT|nr:dolichyl-phosphate-mannose-protein mannosyltransferase domain protein [Leptospira alexanderi serovar Manhao 3 str. L 60]
MDATVVFFSGGLWIKYVFPGIVGLRLFTLVVAALCIFIFYGILFRIGFSLLSALFAGLLLVTDLLFLRVGTMARMEMLCLFFALASLFLLVRTALDEHPRPVGKVEAFFPEFFLGCLFFLTRSVLCLGFLPCIFFGEGNLCRLLCFGWEGYFPLRFGSFGCFLIGIYFCFSLDCSSEERRSFSLCFPFSRRSKF